MNIIDVLIVVFAIASVTRGFRIGLVKQAGSTIGFIFGLFVGSWLSIFFIDIVQSSILKSIIGLIAVLTGGFIFMALGEMAGAWLKLRINAYKPINEVDGGLGSVMAAATVVFACWLGAAILVLGPPSGLQTALKSSRILSSLNSHLPPATELLSSLNKLIDPNGFPEVFRGLEPNPGTAKLPDLGSFNTVVKATQPSVVKVEGYGCGGIVEGSGFVASTDDIVTNAHVVAGVKSPKVIDNNGIHNTRVVWFDPNVDLAVLQVKNLAGTPLKITDAEQQNGTPGVVLGYPGGGSFDAEAAAVLDNFTALGRNIYGQGTTTRDVYSLKAHIIPGNSGGPIIGADGSVLGIVFATSTQYNNVGYALTGHQVAGEVAQGVQSTTSRDTGACSE